MSGIHIISKLDRAREEYEATVDILRQAITTPRASSQTRIELAEAREFTRTTGLCYYCKKPIDDDQSKRHAEACTKCGKLIDALLQHKSRITSGSSSIDSVKALYKAYIQCAFAERLPGALRGVTGEIADVVKAMEPVFEAYEKYRAERKASVAREAADYLRNKRRGDILAMLVQCGADPEAEETKQRVEEIYWDRYADEC